MGVRPGTRRPLTADERAFLEQLVQQYGPRLLGYVRRAYGARVDAEDIVAESFCRAAANVHALRQCDRYDLYLLTIARNLCRDRFRRRAVATDDEPLDDCADVSPRPDESAQHAERRRALVAAVERLPDALREVVALRLGTGLKFEEIAELLGAPLGTVLSRMHSAVQRLRQQLGYDRERE